jgi:hypothetical protein
LLAIIFSFSRKEGSNLLLFSGLFIMNGYPILSTTYSASISIIVWFLFLSLLFWYVVFSSSINLMYLKMFPLRLSLWPVDYLEVCCSISKYLEVFLLYFVHCLLVWNMCSQKMYSFKSFQGYLILFLVNVPWVLKKNVHFAIIRWHNLEMTVKSYWMRMLLSLSAG